MKKWIAIIALFITSQAFAGPGHMVKSAKVTLVSSTSGNQDAFWVHYSSGSGDTCAGKVRFYRSKAGTDGVFERSFSIATTAVVTKMNVDIYSYTEVTDCNSAVAINLKN